MVDLYRSGGADWVMLYRRPWRARCPPGRRTVRVPWRKYLYAFPITEVVSVANAAPLTDATSDTMCPARLSQIGRRMAAELRAGTIRAFRECPASNQGPSWLPEPNTRVHPSDSRYVPRSSEECAREGYVRALPTELDPSVDYQGRVRDII